MRRPMALRRLLAKLTHEAREKLAAEKLTMEAVKEAGVKASLAGHASATILLGEADLSDTLVARALEKQLAGFMVEWVVATEKDGKTNHYLRVSWPVALLAARKASANVLLDEEESGNPEL